MTRKVPRTVRGGYLRSPYLNESVVLVLPGRKEDDRHREPTARLVARPLGEGRKQPRGLSSRSARDDDQSLRARRRPFPTDPHRDRKGLVP